MTRILPQLAPHDPNGTRLRTIKLVLDPGDSILPATTLVPVDSANNVIVGSDFAIELVEIGLISASASGDTWGINFKLRGGADRVGQTEMARIRLRPYLASQPSEPAYDQTYRVEIKQT